MDIHPIKSTYSDDPEMKELIAEFVSALPARINDLEVAATGPSLEQARSLAHQLKGAGGGYGFPQITEAARMAEGAARAKDRAAIGRAITALRALSARMVL